MSTLGIILLVLLLLALGGGYYGSVTPRYSALGYWSWSPVAIIVVILVVLFLSGRL